MMFERREEAIGILLILLKETNNMMNIDLSKKKILFLTNVPSPYRVNFFNELGKYCLLSVVFEKRRSEERDSSWSKLNFVNFDGIFLNGIRTAVNYAFSPGVVGVLSRSFDHIVIMGFTPTNILAALWCKLLGKSYSFECDGGFPKNGKGFKEKLKRFIIRNSVGCFSPGNSCDQYLLFYGASPERIWRYPFTSLFRKEITSKPIDEEERLNIRRQLGITAQRMVLSVGQFIHRKGFDVLLEAQQKIDSNAALYIVGGTPTSEYLDLVKKYGLKNVHFVGFKSRRELQRYYQAADVFVLPTREDIWGLVINEAMANGCPIVSTDRCQAACDLIDGNGFIVPVDSSDELAEKIDVLLKDETFRAKASQRSSEIIQEYTIEKMAERHFEILNKLENDHNFSYK